MLVVLLSKSFYESAACALEVKVALDTGLEITPVRLVEEADLPPRGHQWGDDVWQAAMRSRSSDLRVTPSEFEARKETVRQVTSALEARNSVPPQGAFAKQVNAELPNLFRLIGDKVGVQVDLERAIDALRPASRGLRAGGGAMVGTGQGEMALGRRREGGRRSRVGVATARATEGVGACHLLIASERSFD